MQKDQLNDHPAMHRPKCSGHCREHSPEEASLPSGTAGLSIQELTQAGAVTLAHGLTNKALEEASSRIGEENATPNSVTTQRGHSQSLGPCNLASSLCRGGGQSCPHLCMA